MPWLRRSGVGIDIGSFRDWRPMPRTFLRSFASSEQIMNNVVIKSSRTACSSLFEKLSSRLRTLSRAPAADSACERFDLAQPVDFGLAAASAMWHSE